MGQCKMGHIHTKKKTTKNDTPTKTRLHQQRTIPLATKTRTIPRHNQKKITEKKIWLTKT